MNDTPPPPGTTSGHEHSTVAHSADVHSADVVVVGAGLAGLACARRLAAHQLSVTVLEAGDGVGGRVRSDVIDGFTCDRGFQLINPAYPEVTRVLDVPRLRLQSFPAAVSVGTANRTLTLADPRRAPAQLPATLRSLLLGGLGRPAELLAFARWGLTAGRAPVTAVLETPDQPWGEALTARGITGPLRANVVDLFLAGVVGEFDGDTSHRFVQLLVRSFLRGLPAVPWRGMQAVPDQLAEGLTGIRLGHAVTEVSPGRAVTAAGEFRGRAVVVAADPRTAAALCQLPEVPMRGLTTFWHAAPEAPTSSRALHLDGQRRGPVVNTVVMSNTAPGYSPDERALIATTVLGGAGDQGVERVVLSQLEQLYRTSTRWWELIRTDEIPDALTAMAPPLEPRQPVFLTDGLYVAGDHRDTASIQGALVSGRRTADAVLADLGVPVLTHGTHGQA